MIRAEIVADSLSPFGDRLTSVLVTFPRIILAELNTHRMLSKNSASSRAIPFNKMVQAVQNNPFIPIAWQKEHKGMQGTEYLTGLDYDQAKFEWLEAKDRAIEQAQQLDKIGTTKQLCNRLLEPFMWHTVLISGTEWENFFSLRCPQYWLGNPMDSTKYRSRKDAINVLTNQGFAPNTPFSEWDEVTWLKFNQGQAEIHMMALAEVIWDAMNESTPKELKAGEWHIPFESEIDRAELAKITKENWNSVVLANSIDRLTVKVSTSMNARTSYTIVGEKKEISLEKHIELHDKLVAYNPPHSSPMEHCARVMSEEEYFLYRKGVVTENLDGDINTESHGWCRNFKGFIQYRHLIENGQTF